jgi:hypothetical protein
MREEGSKEILVLIMDAMIRICRCSELREIAREMMMMMMMMMAAMQQTLCLVLSQCHVRILPPVAHLLSCAPHVRAVAHELVLCANTNSLVLCTPVAHSHLTHPFQIHHSSRRFGSGSVMQ